MQSVLGPQVASVEDGAGGLAFSRDLTARRFTGVKLVTSDAHAGLVAAIRATTGGAWQRRRMHYAANLHRPPQRAVSETALSRSLSETAVGFPIRSGVPSTVPT